MLLICEVSPKVCPVGHRQIRNATCFHGGFWLGVQELAGQDTTVMPANKKTALVVDDEPAVRDLVHALLNHFGLEVETANCGVEALAKVDQTNFDLVITDLLMPGMKGDELAKEIKKRRPDLPVVLITGHRPEIIAPEIACVLAKPFSRQELRDAVLALTT
jgi:CheY-like chemotaxis protein